MNWLFVYFYITLSCDKYRTNTSYFGEENKCLVGKTVSFWIWLKLIDVIYFCWNVAVLLVLKSQNNFSSLFYFTNATRRVLIPSNSNSSSRDLKKVQFKEALKAKINVFWNLFKAEWIQHLMQLIDRTNTTNILFIALFRPA